MASNRYIKALVGEHIPVRVSFINRLLDFASTGQSLVGASIVWTSQTPAVAVLDGGSGALVTSDRGANEGVPNDACLGRFEMLSAGQCTVAVTVDAVNPTATYVSEVIFQVEAVNTP